MTQYGLALGITGLRSVETPFLQPLGTNPASATVPDEDLQPVALGVAEQAGDHYRKVKIIGGRAFGAQELFAAWNVPI
jgi:hypothetical protein